MNAIPGKWDRICEETKDNGRVLLYGAYGYTGRLTAELAVAKKLDVVLAGRNRDALAALGERLSLPTRVVSHHSYPRAFVLLNFPNDRFWWWCQSALERDPPSAPKRDPFDRRALLVALAASDFGSCGVSRVQ